MVFVFHLTSETVNVYRRQQIFFARNIQWKQDSHVEAWTWSECFQNMFLTYFLCVDSQETDDLESTLFVGHTLFTCSPIRIRWLLYLRNIYRASFLFRLRLYSNSSIWPFVYIVLRYLFISIWHQMEHKMT